MTATIQHKASNKNDDETQGYAKDNHSNNHVDGISSEVDSHFTSQISTNNMSEPPPPPTRAPQRKL